MLVIYTKLCLTFFLDHYAHKNKKKTMFKNNFEPGHFYGSSSLPGFLGW